MPLTVLPPPRIQKANYTSDYHHVVQGLLSHVGSQGNVRVCRYSKLLLQLYRAKNIILKNKESIFRVILSCPNFYGSIH